MTHDSERLSPYHARIGLVVGPRRRGEDGNNRKIERDEEMSS
jgi:hypothetical protein